MTLEPQPCPTETYFPNNVSKILKIVFESCLVTTYNLVSSMGAEILNSKPGC